MQTGTIQIDRRVIKGQDKFFVTAPWPQYSVISNDMLQFSPPGMDLIDKEGHVQFRLENGYAIYKLARVQVPDGHGLTYELMNWKYSDPPQPPSEDTANLSF